MSKVVEQKVFTGYLPRPLQDKLHYNLKRFNVLVMHRRFGKTIFALNEIIAQALRCDKRNPNYAYIAPTYGAAERIAWAALKEYTANIPGVETNEQKLRVTIDRPGKGDKITIVLLGAENPHAIRGIYLDGVVLDEFAVMDPVIWSQVVRPTLSDRLGWAIFIGTPMGKNHFADIYDHAAKDPTNWFRAIYKSSETNILPASELKEARASMSEEMFNQEYECDFTAALVGAYYGKYLKKARDENRVTVVPHDKALMVDTYWDLGISDTTAIWIGQQFGKEIRWIDYIENSGEGVDWYVGELRRKQHQYNYNYGEHVLPHDANARDLGTGRTRIETLREYGLDGLGRIRVLEKHLVKDGIDAVRMVLDRCWFDAGKCERGLTALENYRQKWDEKNKIYSSAPMHNWASHGADAFRIFAMGHREPIARNRGRELPRQASNDWNPLE